jgi:hypothetical protein
VSEHERDSRGATGFWLAGAAVVAAIFVGVLVFPRGGGGGLSLPGRLFDGAPAPRLAQVANGAENERRLRQLLQRQFPEAHAAVLAAEADAGSGAPERRAAAFAVVQELVLDNAEHLAAAPAGRLRESALAGRDLVIGLQIQDDALCASYAMKGLDGAASLNEASWSLALVSAIADLNAIVAGKAEPTDWSRPTPFDGGLLTRKLNDYGVADTAIRDLATGRLQAAPAAEQCRVSVALYRALADMPPENTARISSQLVRDSAAMLRARR